MNHWLLTNFNAFMAETCKGKDLFGQCCYICQDFLLYLQKRCDKEFQLTSFKKNEVSLLYQAKETTVRVVDSVCSFRNMCDFQKHSLKMCETLTFDNTHKKHVQCFMIEGLEFTYCGNNVFTNSRGKRISSVGFLHWILLVTREDEVYVFDPTLSQFHTLPESLVVHGWQKAPSPIMRKIHNVYSILLFDTISFLNVFILVTMSQYVMSKKSSFVITNLSQISSAFSCGFDELRITFSR
jgi:hypothetical protein